MLVHPLNHITKPSVLLYSIQAVFLSLLLFSCAYSPETEFLAKDSNGFEILMSQFANDIENTWGSNEVLIAGPKDYVKYTDQYQTRSHINFDKGIITIETLATTEPQQRLQKAIIKTLLMSEEPNNETLFGDQNISVNQQPLLYEQVLDHQRQPICSQWHADQFSQYLLDHSLSKRITGFRQIWAVNIPLVAHHLDYRVHKYISIVRRASRQYKVDQSLILAIIQTESSFNPYAVSYANALGLMQVVPTSAGRDVFSLVKNRRGKPARRYLFNPENNIDTGTAYLYLLQNVYLSGISNPMSRRYAVISAYNSGAGSVLRTFSPDKNEAVTIINTLSPDQVYQTLTTQHPSVQARHYLQKVTRAHRQYRRTV